MSRVVADAGKQVIGIPTAAQLAIILLAQQYTQDWQLRLETNGECVPLADIANKTTAIFAPSQVPQINSANVDEQAVTDAAEYVYWTAGGAQVSIKWDPQTTQGSTTSLSATYIPTSGGPMLDVPVRPFSRQFQYDELWVQSTSDKSIQLTSPPANDAYASSSNPPTGTGVVTGALSINDSARHLTRVVNGQGTFTSGLIRGLHWPVKYYSSVIGGVLVSIG